MNNRRWWLRNIVVPLAVCLALFATNPSRDAVQGFGARRAQETVFDKIWSLTSSISSGLRSIVAEEKYFNFHILSLIQYGRNSYSIGVSGFWIPRTYWTSIPCWYLLVQMIWALLESARSLAYLWIEVLISILWFVFISLQLEPTFHLEKYESTFYLVCSLCNYVVAHAVLFPSGMFRKTQLQPGSMLYGMGSAMLVYLAMMQDRPGYRHSATWLRYEVEFSQLALVVVLLQLMLGSPMGFAGSITGIIMYMLVAGGILDERRW